MPAWGGVGSSKADANGTRHGADMDETVLKLLDADDGEPDLPFYFVWANEAFVWKWQWPHGRVAKLAPGAQQVPQNYERAGWWPHFRYLLPFFQHSNYHRVDGKPVFAVYEALQKSPTAQGELDDMMQQFHRWALHAGLGGLHVLQFHHEGFLNDVNGLQRLRPWANGVQSFGRRHRLNGHELDLETQPAWLPEHIRWYPGLFLGFDNTPRMGKKAGVNTALYNSFALRVDNALNYTLRIQASKPPARSPAMLLLVAFNEWSEGCVLEPNSVHGVRHLITVRDALSRHGQLHRSPGGHKGPAVPAQRVTKQLSKCAPSPPSLLKRLFGERAAHMSPSRSPFIYGKG